MAVPPLSCPLALPGAADGCHDILRGELIWSMGVVIIVGLFATFVQCLGLVFAVLAYKEAPTQQERDQLLSEEAKRLNDSWTTTTVQKF